MEFACTQLAPERIVRCAFGLTRLEFSMFSFLCSTSRAYTSGQLQEEFSVNRASAQRALKKMHDAGLVKRLQTNFSEGGYEYAYELLPRPQLRRLLKDRLALWVEQVEKDVLSWSRQKFASD